MANKKYIIVHYSDSTTGNARIFEKYHIEKNGWSKLGYNYVIPRDGSIENIIGETEVGVHAPGYNTNGIGICVVCSKEESYTVWQYRMLVFLINTLMSKYGVKIEHVLGHKETGRNTDCPGPIEMEKLRKDVLSSRSKYKEFMTSII